MEPDQGCPADAFPGAFGAAPTSARAYGWLLGGKDNYAVDREFALGVLKEHPANLDVARDNRRFLGRAVRYLTREAGVQQFLDLGCGLPTDNNVHQVAQLIEPSARVVYVDIDPVVLAHGRALLADDAATTAIITADMRDPEAVLKDPVTQQLIDFSNPFAALFFSVGHHLLDAAEPRKIIDCLLDAGPPGSYIAFSQVVDEDVERGESMSQKFNQVGIPWQTRTPRRGRRNARRTGARAPRASQRPQLAACRYRTRAPSSSRRAVAVPRRLSMGKRHLQVRRHPPSPVTTWPCHQPPPPSGRPENSPAQAARIS